MCHAGGHMSVCRALRWTGRRKNDWRHGESDAPNLRYIPPTDGTWNLDRAKMASCTGNRYTQCLRGQKSTLETAQHATMCMSETSSSSVWCLWISGFGSVSWLADTPLPLLPHAKGQAWLKSANETFIGPRGSGHTLLHFLWLTAWPLLISLLTLQPFMTLPCVIIAPRWGHASLERKREGRGW